MNRIISLSIITLSIGAWAQANLQNLVKQDGQSFHVDQGEKTVRDNPLPPADSPHRSRLPDFHLKSLPKPAKRLQRTHVLTGGQDGNGGDAVVCRNPDGQIRTAQLLDFYEHLTFDGGQLDLGGNHLNAIEKVSYALSRMRRVAPTRALLYEEGLKNFLYETEFVQGPLVDLPDQGPTGLPRGCRLEQLAIQTTCYPGELYSNPTCFAEQFYFENYYSWSQTIHGRKRYEIDAEIWSALDENSKAGLIIHELLYREFANLEGLKTSDSVRKMTSLLSSKNMVNISQEEFNRIANLSVADVDFKTSLGRMTLFIMRKSPYSDHSNEAVQLYFPVQSLRNEVRDLPVRFFVNGAAYFADFKARPRDFPIVMGPFWPIEPLDNLRSDRMYAFKKGEPQWIQLASESPDLKYHFKAQNRDYMTRGYGLHDERLYLNLRGTQKVKILGQEVEVGSSVLDNTTLGFNINSGLFVFGKLAQALELTGANFKVRVAEDSIISLRSDAGAIRFLTQASGFYSDPWSTNTFHFGNAQILLTNRGEIQYLASHEPQGLMRAQIEIYPGKKVEVQKSFAKLDYVSRLGHRVEEFQFGIVTNGIPCTFKGVKYVARTNVSLRLGQIPSELPKIVKADEIPMMYDPANEYDLEFCQVIKESK